MIIQNQKTVKLRILKYMIIKDDIVTSKEISDALGIRIDYICQALRGLATSGFVIQEKYFITLEKMPCQIRRYNYRVNPKTKEDSIRIIKERGI